MRITNERLWMMTLIVAIILLASPGLTQDTLSENRNSRSPERTIRVLTIGNSFAGNACRYLREIADSEGTVRIVIGSANIGGCSLEKHANLAEQSAGDASVRPYTDRMGGSTTKRSLQEYLKSQPWDFVTLQQQSWAAISPESYHPHIESLAAIIYENAPGARVWVHQTWAYHPDAQLLKDAKMTQDEMHERLRESYAAAAKSLDAEIIPVGTAMQLARRSDDHKPIYHDPDFDFDNPEYPKLPNQRDILVVGWSWKNANRKNQLRFDYRHCNDRGCFLAGLVWYKALTGNDPQTTSFAPKGISETDASFFRATAHAAFEEQKTGAPAQVH